jgi:hypothetical protein
MSDEKHPVQTVDRRRGGKVAAKVTLQAYEVYCALFVAQVALVTGECRGGFGTGELIALLYARNFPRNEWRERFHEAVDSMENLG